jgi:DNA-binding NtrC family response regulator
MDRSVVYAWLDARSDFFGVLGAKLEGCELVEFNEDYSRVDGLIVGIPSREDPTFDSRVAVLTQAVLNPAAVPVIALVRTPERQVIRKCLSVGAFDYFVESGSIEELQLVLQRAARYYEMHREITHMRDSMHRPSGFGDIIGMHESMVAVFNLANRVATTDANVLITGESGTGKELLARVIHESSGRARHPFVAVSCTAFPESLIETELFGHEKGAFTGAVTMRKGRFEAAENGTIFLDEIGELPAPIQTKLLRVLQERTFERLGSNVPRPMTARVICATHRDLKECVKQGTFRLDLYYRLHTIQIALPPLRERWGDVEVLAHTFVKTYAERYNRPAQRFSPAVMSALRQHDWPGNVRELQHVVERAVVICEGPEIKLEHLPAEIAGRAYDCGEFSFDEEVRSFKRRLIERALIEAGYNKLRAARSLKMPRTSLHRLIDDLSISDSKVS